MYRIWRKEQKTKSFEKTSYTSKNKKTIKKIYNAITQGNYLKCEIRCEKDLE